MERDTGLVKLLRRVYHVLDERVDRSLLGNYWQRWKWCIAYQFRKNNRVPAFENLIRQPHRSILVDTVRGLGDIASVLEIGCGRGQNLYLLSHAIPGIALCGIDISVAAISQARRELEARGIVGVRLEVGGGEALTAFGSRSIDIVIADAVLTYIPPRQIIVVINEMLRVARKGIILGTWHFEPDSSGKPWLYDEGAWVYDYRRLLGRYSGLAISIVPYPEDVWTDARWNRYGVVLTARFG